jgi:hypothetical protein
MTTTTTTRQDPHQQRLAMSRLRRACVARSVRHPRRRRLVQLCLCRRSRRACRCDGCAPARQRGCGRNHRCRVATAQSLGRGLTPLDSLQRHGDEGALATTATTTTTITPPPLQPGQRHHHQEERNHRAVLSQRRDVATLLYSRTRRYNEVVTRLHRCHLLREHARDAEIRAGLIGPQPRQHGCSCHY